MGRLAVSLLPSLGLALACGWPLLLSEGQLLWFDRRLLAMLIELEWVVLAAGMFFVFPMMMPGHTRAHNAIRWVFFGLLLWGAGVLAHAIGRWTGVAHYVGLVWVTYAGTMLAGADFERRGGTVLAAIARWVVQLAAFAVLYVSLDLGSFRPANDRVLAAGVIYFGLLAGLELVWFRWVVPRVNTA